MSLDDQIRSALAKAGIGGWEVLSADPSVVLRDSNGSCLTITLGSIEWYEHWFDHEHERIVALVRAVLSSGVAADVATRLGVAFEVGALLGWCEARGWKPFVTWNDEYERSLLETDHPWAASVRVPDGFHRPMHPGESPAHALALACLAALDRAEGA